MHIFSRSGRLPHIGAACRFTLLIFPFPVHNLAVFRDQAAVSLSALKRMSIVAATARATEEADAMTTPLPDGLS